AIAEAVGERAQIPPNRTRREKGESSPGLGEIVDAWSPAFSSFSGRTGRARARSARRFGGFVYPMDTRRTVNVSGRYAQRARRPLGRRGACPTLFQLQGLA